MHGWFFLFLFFLPVKQVVIFAWRGFTVIPVSTFERVGLAVRLEAFTRMEIGLESYNCTGSTDLPAALPSLPLRTFPGTAFLAWTAIGRGTGLSFASSIYIYIYIRTVNFFVTFCTKWSFLTTTVSKMKFFTAGH